MERTFGWRHFRAVQKQGQGKAAMVLLQATCDESTQFWVRRCKVSTSLGCAAPAAPLPADVVARRGRIWSVRC